MEGAVEGYPGHRIYPCLPHNLAVTRPNQVRAIDITNVPMAQGFVYLVAVVDWFSRRVLAWLLPFSGPVAPLVRATMTSGGGLWYPGRHRRDRPIRLP